LTPKYCFIKGVNSDTVGTSVKSVESSIILQITPRHEMTRPRLFCAWPATIDEARALQTALAKRVRLVPLPGRIRTVTAVDAAFFDTRIAAAAVTVALDTLRPVEQAHSIEELSFPYVPGYLSFREGHAIICALRNLAMPIEVLLVDGQGIAHPRRCGIASHIGVLLDLPSIGCAKSRLVGAYTEPALQRGAWSPLTGPGGAVLGAAVRTREATKPVFVSPGHRIVLSQAVEIVLRCTGKHRIPDPLRAADRLSRDLRKRPASKLQ
jgi:deoxyribonuclease V